MKILWFSVTPSLYSSYSNSHNGGGWISSLEKEIRKCEKINLSIAFMLGKEDRKEVIDNVTYFSIHDKKNNLQRYLSIVNDVKPDIIQIFGSENDFGEICNHTKIPVVIHMQGSIPPYHNALFPIGVNVYDFIFGKGLSWRRRLMGLLSERSFRKRAKKEIAVIQSCKYFLGRTEWDKSLINLFNPSALYYHQEEALRDVFINSDLKWKYNTNDKIKITSVISNPWYKGVDVILKTANLLSKHTDLRFEWNIYGVSDIKFYEKKYKIKSKDVSVDVRGSVSKEELIDALLRSNCYIHPSYIENSPNSICEAQVLGLPIIATNVGGISSIVKDNHSGILVPANDPYTLAVLIKRITGDEELSSRLGNNAYIQAKERHDPNKIGESLINIYNKIIIDNGNDCNCS